MFMARVTGNALRGEKPPSGSCQAPEDVERCFIIDPQIELDERTLSLLPSQSNIQNTSFNSTHDKYFGLRYFPIYIPATHSASSARRLTPTCWAASGMICHNRLYQSGSFPTVRISPTSLTSAGLGLPF